MVAYNASVADARADRAERNETLEANRAAFVTEKALWTEESGITEEEAGDFTCDLTQLYSYKKLSVWIIALTSLAQVGAMVQGSSMVLTEAGETTSEKLTTWESMTSAFTLFHGITGFMALLGAFGIFPRGAAWLIRHWFGNFYRLLGWGSAAAMAYYTLDSTATEQDLTLLQSVGALNVVAVLLQYWFGSEAVFYLLEGDDPYADKVLRPSLYYFVFDHEERFGYAGDIPEE